MKGNMEYNISDLEILARSSRKDWEDKRWVAYPDYIVEFNRLLKAFEESGIDTSGIDSIEPVPEGKKAAMGVGSSTEQRKLREIVTKTERLLARIPEE